MKRPHPAARVWLGIPPTESDYRRAENRFDRRLRALEACVATIVVAAAFLLLAQWVLR